MDYFKNKIKKLPVEYRNRFRKLIPLLENCGKLKVRNNDVLIFEFHKNFYIINTDNTNEFIRDVEYLENHLLDLQKIAFINKLKAE